MPDDVVHPALTRARYRMPGGGDKFVGLWLEVMVTIRNDQSPQRIINSFYADPDLRAAVATVGQDLVDDQLRDAARRYFVSCLDDPSYTTGLFGLQRLKPELVLAKMASEVSLATTILAELGESAAALPRLLAEGYQAALGPDAD